MKPLAGMILPAGSPLVQFEVTNEAHGGAKKTRGIIWVSRIPKKQPWCAGPAFNAPDETDQLGERIGLTYVCLCQGRFIE